MSQVDAIGTLVGLVVCVAVWLVLGAVLRMTEHEMPFLKSFLVVMLLLFTIWVVLGVFVVLLAAFGVGV